MLCCTKDSLSYVEKCFSGKLEQIGKSKLPTSDDKSRNLGKGRLDPAALSNFRKYFTQAIGKHAKPGILSAADQEMLNKFLAELTTNNLRVV